MHTKNVGNILPKTDMDKTISSNLSEALQNTHRGMNYAIHHIGTVIGVNGETVKKWYEGKNPPNAAHLLMLMRYYPAVLSAVLELIGREDLWQLAVRSGIEKSMVSELCQIEPAYQIWGDMHVTPLAPNPSENPVDPQDRQVWFMSQIRQKGKMRSQDAAKIWGVSLRTAQRDTEIMRDAGLIKLVRVGRDSWYELI